MAQSTLVAEERCVLWKLHRAAFRQFLASSAVSDSNSTITALKKSKLLRQLSLKQIQRLSKAASRHTFEAGDIILRKGDTGNAFFVILDGNVSCSNIGTGSSKRGCDVSLHTGDYFGELALLGDGTRNATVTASTKTTCIVVERAAFHRIVGDLRHEIEVNAMLAEVNALTCRTIDGLSVPQLIEMRELERGPVAGPALSAALRGIAWMDTSRRCLSPNRGPTDQGTVRSVAEPHPKK